MFNWREIPLVRILVPFIIGILLAMEFNKAFPFLNYLLLFLVFPLAWLFKASFTFHYRWIYGFFINLFFLILAYQLCFYYTGWNQKNHFRQYIDSENTLIGAVVNVPVSKEKRVNIHLNIQQIDSVSGVNGKILLSLKKDSLSQALSYGDRLICRTKLKTVQGPLNPQVFDYRAYLHLKNIDYQGFVKETDWQQLDSLQGNRLLHFAFTARQKFLSILAKHIKTENELAVASALILGYKEDLNQELKKAYANTGAMHVLAVSGLHVGLIWGILAFILGWIRWKNPFWKWIKTGLIICSLWAFALITGASPSVLRAATMFTFLILGTSFKRTANIYNTLAASALVLLCINPFLIKEVGFQLSYLAVIGIVYFYPKIYRQWYIENKIGNFIWQLTAVAIAAQLTTFPLSLYYFHQFPLYFWLSGLVVVPFAFLILGSGVLLFVLELIAPIIAVYFAYLLNGMLWIMNALIFLIEQIPSGLISGIWISGAILLLIYLALWSISLGINSKRFKWITATGMVSVVICGVLGFEGCQSVVQKEIVFYHVPGKSYMEFIDEKSLIAFGDIEIPEKNLDYTTANYHFYKGIETKESYHFGFEKLVKEPWMQQHNFVQFYDKKLVCLKQLPDRKAEKKIAVDFLLIRKDADLEISEIADYFEPALIILDGSLNQNELLDYKRGCIASGIPYYDIRAMGALIFKFTPG